MGLTALPAKSDASIGRVKTDIGAAPNLDNYVPADEYEVLKDFLIDVCDEVGIHAGLGGSLNARTNALEVTDALGLQGAYNVSPAVTLATGVPVALTTFAVGEVGFTVTDGADTVSVYGDRIEAGAALVSDGAVGAPAVGFISEASGLYLATAGSPALAVLGVNSMAWAATGFAANGSLVSVSADETAFELTATINKVSGTNNYSALGVNAVETLAPGADNRLLDLQVGGADRAHVTAAGAIRTASGTAAAPAHAFHTATDTGFYRPAAGRIGISAAGLVIATLRQLTDSATIMMNITASVNQTAGHTTGFDYLRLNPTITSDSGTGEKNYIVARRDATAYFKVTWTGEVLAKDGTSSLPGWGFVDEPATGAYRPATNQLGLVANSEAVIVDNDGATPSFRPDANAVWNLGESSFRWDRLFADSGSITAPSISVGEGDVGLYRPTTNQLGLVANDEAVIVDNDDTIPSFRPGVDDTWALGEASFRWTTVHSVSLDTGDINLHGMNDDANYTLVESREGLFLRDHVTGKAFRLLMEEVDSSTAPRTREELAAA